MSYCSYIMSYDCLLNPGCLLNPSNALDNTLEVGLEQSDLQHLHRNTFVADSRPSEAIFGHDQLTRSITLYLANNAIQTTSKEYWHAWCYDLALKDLDEQDLIRYIHTSFRVKLRHEECTGSRKLTLLSHLGIPKQSRKTVSVESRQAWRLAEITRIITYTGYVRLNLMFDIRDEMQDQYQRFTGLFARKISYQQYQSLHGDAKYQINLTMLYMIQHLDKFDPEYINQLKSEICEGSIKLVCRNRAKYIQSIDYLFDYLRSTRDLPFGKEQALDVAAIKLSYDSFSRYLEGINLLQIILGNHADEDIAYLFFNVQNLVSGLNLNFGARSIEKHDKRVLTCLRSEICPYFSLKDYLTMYKLISAGKYIIISFSHIKYRYRKLLMSFKNEYGDLYKIIFGISLCQNHHSKKYRDLYSVCFDKHGLYVCNNGNKIFVPKEKYNSAIIKEVLGGIYVAIYTKIDF